MFKLFVLALFFLFLFNVAAVYAGSASSGIAHVSPVGDINQEYIVLGLFGMVVVAVPSLAIGLVIRKRKEK